MTEQQLRQKVVNTARGWLGRRESDGSHRAIIDLYNAHKPLARAIRCSTRTRGARRSSLPSLSNAALRTLCRSNAGARL